MSTFPTDLIGATVMGYSEQPPKGSEMMGCIIVKLRTGKMAKIKVGAGRDNEWMEVLE